MSIASLTTNLHNGITNAHKDSAMGTLTQLDPTKLHTYFNDFNLYNASDWVVTVVEAGTGSATQAIVDENGGVLKLTNDNADADSVFLQLTNETFKFVSGKQLYFKARIKTSSLSNQEFVIGLQRKDTTPLAVPDGVYFQSFGAASPDFNLHVTKNGVSSSGVSLPRTQDYMDVAFIYDGESEVSYWLDDVKLGTLDTTNLPDDEELTISFGTQNVLAFLRSMHIDFIYVANER